MLDTSTIPTAFPYPFEPHMHDPTATFKTCKIAYHLDILIILNACCLAGISSRLKITAFVSCLIILDGHQKRKKLKSLNVRNLINLRNKKAHHEYERNFCCLPHFLLSIKRMNNLLNPKIILIYIHKF